jgi:signal peptidase I
MLVLVPVVMLVLLPTVLGLDRYVVSERSMDGSLGRGSVVMARQVGPTDLAVGDVITFRPPGGKADERVTRRIVAIEGDVATTRADNADAAGSTASLQLRLSREDTYARVWLGVPWIGYPFVMDGGWLLLAAAALAALVLAFVAGRHAPQKVVTPSRAGLSVG